jgi:hypothetical protein
MSPYGGTAMDGDGRMIVASDDSHRAEAQQPRQPAPSLVPCCDESTCLFTPVAPTPTPIPHPQPPTSVPSNIRALRGEKVQRQHIVVVYSFTCC